MMKRENSNMKYQVKNLLSSVYITYVYDSTIIPATIR